MSSEGPSTVYEAMDAEGDAAPVAGGSQERLPPPGFVVHTEGAASILFAVPESANAAGVAPVFLNPVQQYNRDLSIVAIRTWSQRRQAEKEATWEAGLKKKWAKDDARKAREAAAAAKGEEGEGGDGKRRKLDDGSAVAVDAVDSVEPVASTSTERVKPTPPVYKFTCLEALSATGLRAIRYAKEIPLLGYVVANDLSASAVQDINRNIEYNGLLPTGLPEGYDPESKSLTKHQVIEATLGRVRANEGDAMSLMYSHRNDSRRFDCIDLDPYGTAVPFLDAAIGAVADGGLMAITCTDLGVLAGHNYPEKAFSLYGGVCVSGEYCHEVALRLVLNAIASTAGRYGRYIEPLVSLSIDFYVRVFIRVYTGPVKVKDLASQTSLLYYCHDCHASHMTPLGRTIHKGNNKNGTVNKTYHTPQAPPAIGDRCTECGGKYHIGGPMWNGPLHDPEFVGEMLDELKTNWDDFATASRIEGMLTVAQSELPDPLYFTPGKMSGLFHCISPPLVGYVSAILNGGYNVSRSHACAGSLKTNAPRSFLFDIMREWIKTNPIKMENFKQGSPARRLVEKAQVAEVSMARHPDAEKAMMSKIKLVRYQPNPEAHWGPGKAASKK